MEERETFDHEHHQAAKAQLVLLMQTGYPWHKAAATAGLQISRSTAYRLLQAVRTQGEAALQDGRHGHPAKLREAVLQWLQAFCRTALHKRQAEKCKQHCKNNSASTSVLVTSIESVPN